MTAGYGAELQYIIPSSNSCSWMVVQMDWCSPGQSLLILGCLFGHKWSGTAKPNLKMVPDQHWKASRRCHRRHNHVWCWVVQKVISHAEHSTRRAQTDVNQLQLLVQWQTSGGVKLWCMASKQCLAAIQTGTWFLAGAAGGFWKSWDQFQIFFSTVFQSVTLKKKWMVIFSCNFWITRFFQAISCSLRSCWTLKPSSWRLLSGWRLGTVTENPLEYPYPMKNKKEFLRMVRFSL